MSNDQVKKQKKKNRPVGYDSFKKPLISRSTQIQHGREKGLEAQQHAKVSMSALYEKIRKWKEKGVPLEDVVIVKAEPNARDTRPLKDGQESGR